MERKTGKLGAFLGSSDTSLVFCPSCAGLPIPMSDAEAAAAPSSPPKSPKKEDATEQAGEPQDEGAKLYIGNLAFKTDEDGLRDAFSKFGNITFARVIYDRMTDRSRYDTSKSWVTCACVVLPVHSTA